ncbi:MAG TPA: transketolase C-terminal domain-containing protein, partial [Solirubrobacteraceae bacterium]|nr:transketolase C-terminal domain-containing protein [Solirubrobacteraceae bacterium]
YFRIGKASASVPNLDGRFKIGALDRLRLGEDVAIVALGSMAGEAAEAATMLALQGISAGVAVLASVQPAPLDDLVELLSNVPHVATVEAHYRTGGLGSLVAEVIAEHGLRCRLVRHAVETMPRGAAGALPFLNDLHGLSARALTESIATELSRAYG